MKKVKTAFLSTVNRFVLNRGWLVNFHLARDGWWITDRNGFKHHLPFSVQRIEAPDGLIAWRITAWRLNVEWGKIQNIQVQP